MPLLLFRGDPPASGLPIVFPVMTNDVRGDPPAAAMFEVMPPWTWLIALFVTVTRYPLVLLVALSVSSMALHRVTKQPEAIATAADDPMVLASIVPVISD